mgnify:FL=1
MVTGRGRTKPGARTTRPASSRPARTRGEGSRRLGAAASATTAAKSAASSAAQRAAAGVPAVAGWRARVDRARRDARLRRYLLLGAALLFLGILVGPTLKAYIGQRQEISALREQVATQTKAVDELKAEQARWQDPAYIEQQARERLKFVKVGEKAYTVIDPEDTRAEVDGMASAPRDSAWYVTVWSSLKAADAPAAAP